MKKLFGFIFLLLLVLFIIVLPELDGDSYDIANDSEERTYKNVVYDIAYSNSKNDGLRARVYTYYLFSENDNKVLEYIRLTAGGGRQYLYEGTYEGSLDGTITITTDNPNKSEEYKCFFGDYGMRDENGNEYNKENVRSVIININNHF